MSAGLNGAGAVALRPSASDGHAPVRVGVALYGLGNVGGGLSQVIEARRQALAAHHGIALSVRHVVVRDPAKPRPVPVDGLPLGTDWRAPLDDPAVDVVVEAMGGFEPAGTVAVETLRSGRPLVTANKALVAATGAELEDLAAAAGATIRYEGAVGGAIPVLHTLRGALIGNRIRCVRGILNGTTNYILTRMTVDGLAFADALARAQELGFAEADPTADVSGMDAAQKLILLARHAFGRWLPLENVSREGIELVSPDDIERARQVGRTVKLIAEAVRHDDGGIALEVRPMALPAPDPLAGVPDEMNAIQIEGDFSGPLLMRGRGAGARATASAVYADLVETALAVAERQRVRA